MTTGLSPWRLWSWRPLRDSCWDTWRTSEPVLDILQVHYWANQSAEDASVWDCTTSCITSTNLGHTPGCSWLSLLTRLQTQILSTKNTKNQASSTQKEKINTGHLKVNCSFLFILEIAMFFVSSVRLFTPTPPPGMYLSAILNCSF